MVVVILGKVRAALYGAVLSPHLGVQDDKQPVDTVGMHRFVLLGRFGKCLGICYKQSQNCFTRDQSTGSQTDTRSSGSR
jgi:hypothetical protein